MPPNESRSITEIEFDHARLNGKGCLCYVVSEKHAWLPTLMETGAAADSLRRFKEKVSALVRSQFTTPDDLAKQVAADIGRELAAPAPRNSVGDLLARNWDRFAPELQDVLLVAFAQAQRDARDGVVATRHVFSALAATSNTSGSLLQPMLQKHADKQLIDPLRPDLQEASTLRAFQHDKPFSGCVLGSLERLLPSHSPVQRLMAMELAADLLKNGRGNSVMKFRQAGIDGLAVERAVEHVQHVSRDRAALLQALGALNEGQLRQLAFAADLPTLTGLSRSAQVEDLIDRAAAEKKLLLLVGELARRHPNLMDLGN